MKQDITPDAGMVGTKFWSMAGKIHKEDGPAIEWRDGNVSWFLDGKKYEFDDWAKEVGWSDEQIVMYKLEHF